MPAYLTWRAGLRSSGGPCTCVGASDSVVGFRFYLKMAMGYLCLYLRRGIVAVQCRPYLCHIRFKDELVSHNYVTTFIKEAKKSLLPRCESWNRDFPFSVGYALFARSSGIKYGSPLCGCLRSISSFHFSLFAFHFLQRVFHILQLDKFVDYGVDCQACGRVNL